jgi:hypothetical protein
MGQLIQLSVIVRFHEGANINLLTRALYCLLDETVLSHEVIVVVQYTDESVLDRVRELCASLFHRIPFRVEGVRVPAGEDRRGQLLADGIALANGEHIAFLDYDDMLFLTGTAKAIDICKSDNADMAVAQCFVAYIEGIFPNDYVVTKERFVIGVPQNPLRLLVKNFAPICACIVSRAFLARTGITVSPDAKLLEDYELVLKVLAEGTITLRPLAEAVVNSQYNFNIDAGGTTMQLCLDEEVQKREAPRWQAERERLWNTIMPKLKISLDFRTLRDLMLPPREPQATVLDLPAFVSRVRNERAKT